MRAPRAATRAEAPTTPVATRGQALEPLDAGANPALSAAAEGHGVTPLSSQLALVVHV